MLALNGDDVPRIFRIIVTIDDVQVANTTTYAMPNEQNTLKARILSAYQAEVLREGQVLSVEVFPA